MTDADFATPEKAIRRLLELAEQALAEEPSEFGQGYVAGLVTAVAAIENPGQVDGIMRALEDMS